MNIYATNGHRVKCSNLTGGYDQTNAKKHLTVGNVYKIDYTEVGGYNTDVFLQEFPGIRFNSVFFEDDSVQDLENNKKHPDFYKFNMSHSSKIKHECEKIYGIIKRAEERLKELREKCKHENTHQGLYSSRVGSITEAIICSDCGSLIKNVINNNIRIE